MQEKSDQKSNDDFMSQIFIIFYEIFKLFFIQRGRQCRQQHLMILKQYIILMCRRWRSLTEEKVIHDLENEHLHTVNQLLFVCKKFFMRFTGA